MSLASRFLARAVVAPPCPPPACAAAFARCFATVSSSAPASRSAPPSSSPSAPSAGPNVRIPAAVFRSKLPSSESQLAEYYRLQRKNALLGSLLFLAVASIWGYSVWVTEDVKEKFTTPEVQQIEAELEKEDREAAAAEKRK